MKYTLLIAAIALIMAFLSGCATQPKCANQNETDSDGGCATQPKCANPDEIDSRGGCSARWM